MKVCVNGDEKEIDEGLTVEGLLNELSIGKERVAVELNLDIVPKNRFTETILKDGDKIEVVSFVGGG